MSWINRPKNRHPKPKAEIKQHVRLALAEVQKLVESRGRVDRVGVEPGRLGALALEIESEKLAGELRDCRY